MDSIKDIIVKTELTEAEMLYVIEQYIKEKKNVDVSIGVCRNQIHLWLMNSAYSVASEYFFNKENEV